MSRNAHSYARKTLLASLRLCGLSLLCALDQTPGADSILLPENLTPRSRVVIVHDPEATEAFEPRMERVLAMVQRAVTNLTGKTNSTDAWRSLVSTQDTIGIKIYSSPGPRSGTRPAVVAAVVEGLLAAGIPAKQIVIWDKHRADLRQAGFFDLAARYGVRVQGSANAGYDDAVFYDTPLLGHPIWGDLEFGRQGQSVGRKSFVSKLVAKEVTKIINITPLLNHNRAGVAGNLYSLSMGSVDNTIRFETDIGRLAEAVPEIYALPSLGDRVALNIVDALICQYQGEQRSLLHYSAVLNELRFSTDPVALDMLSLEELERQRKTANIVSPSWHTNTVEIYQNAALLELGSADLSHVQVQRVR